MSWKDHDEALKNLDAQEDKAAKDGILTTTDQKPERKRYVRKLERGELIHELENVRATAAVSLLFQHVSQGKLEVPVHWIWMSETGGQYELRKGNPPADQDRPPHLRGLDLWVDVGEISMDIRNAVQVLQQRRHSMTQGDVAQMERARKIFTRQIERLADDRG